MNKQYIAPSMFAVNLLGTGIIATSTNSLDDTPSATIDYNTMGTKGASSADVKGSANTWDDEW